MKGEHQPALGFEERKKLVRQQILDFCREKEELLTNAEAADDIIEEIRQGKKRSSRREAFLLVRRYETNIIIHKSSSAKGGVDGCFCCAPMPTFVLLAFATLYNV